ncbi:DUF3841 domain-containing protein [Pseudomonas luteola]
MALSEFQRTWSRHFANEQGRIRAWTFVPKEIAEKIESGAITDAIEDTSEFHDESYQQADAWMIEAMDRAGITRPAGTVVPWFCWVQTGCPGDVPCMGYGGADKVLLELSLPSEEILISDADKFHMVIIYSPVCQSWEEHDAFDAECNQAGFNYHRQRPVAEPFHGRIVSSWDSAFDLSDDSEYFGGPLDNRTLQCTIWQLKPEYIVGRVVPSHSCFEDDPDEQEDSDA